MSNELYGQGDLFSYFGDDFAEPLAQGGSADKEQADVSSEQPAASESAEAPNNGIEEKGQSPASREEHDQGEKASPKVVSLTTRKMLEKRVGTSAAPSDACTDTCDPDESSDSCAASNQDEESELDDDEREALREEEDDEEAADKRELAGQSGNTSVVKTDEKTPAAPAKKEEKKPELNHMTFICYSGLNLSITKFFTEDKLASLTLEDVRKKLEKDYPELSKQRTKMEWDEKKNIIVPIVTGGKKGAYFINGTRGFFSSTQELIKHQEPINFLAAREGFFEIRENPIGVFVAKSTYEELLEWDGFEDFAFALPSNKQLDSCRPGFKFKLPKIPKQLFAQLVSFFMDYTDYDVEVMGVFYYDTETGRYVLDVPYQQVSKVSVDPCYTSFPPHFVKVAEVHSHNTMRADFSSIDDADELGTMLYGVVGKLLRCQTSVFFDVRTRAGMAGKFIPLDPKVFIEGCLISYQLNNRVDYVDYPTEWRTRVTIIKDGEAIDNA